MDLEDVGCKVKYLIQDRDGTYPGMFDANLADAGLKVVLSGIRPEPIGTGHYSKSLQERPRRTASMNSSGGR
jgi:hypothetical protein